MLMVKELNKASVFDYVEGRHHQCFPKIVANVFSSIDQAKLRISNFKVNSKHHSSINNSLSFSFFIMYTVCCSLCMHVCDYFKYSSNLINI